MKDKLVLEVEYDGPAIDDLKGCALFTVNSYCVVQNRRF